VRLAIGINDGPYRLRTASDATWAPSYGFGQRATLGRRIGDAARAVLRTAVPVLALIAALVAMFLYKATPVPYLGGTAGLWMTISTLLLPVAFLTINLTNRRYGPSYAFAQIMVSFAILAAIAIFAGDAVQRLLPDAAMPQMRETLAFVGAFLLSGFLSIVGFDASRGPRWWTAPLIGSIFGALSFTPVFFPATYLGTAVPWLDRALIETGVLCAGAVAMLLPFWLLRRMVQPLPGFGGY
jgi:hypothetical protein